MNKYLAILMLLGASTVSMPSNSAESIGRLFTTTGERSNLEYLRKTRKNIPVKPEQPSEPNVSVLHPIQSLPDEVSLQGYVKRNDGKAGTVWINDKALQEQTGNKEVTVGKLPDESNRIPVKITGNGRYIGLKAGQVYDPATNRVREARSHAAQGEEVSSGRIGDEGSQ